MRIRISITELIAKQESFKRAHRVMVRRMKQASKISEMQHRKQADSGNLMDEKEQSDDEP